jgi:hypothetical protein
LTRIETPMAQPLPSPNHFTRLGDYVYVITGERTDPGLYRTDGLTAELVADLDSFTFTYTIHSMFELGGSLYLAAEDFVNDELHIYRSDGGTPFEVVRQPAKAFYTEMLFSDETRAYYWVRDGQLLSFDGSSFQPIGNFLRSPKITEVGGRLFVSGFGQLPDSNFFEIINDSLVPLGRELVDMTEFHGEVFGFNADYGSPRPHYTLWRTENGQLVRLSDFTGTIPITSSPAARFIEYNGQLYFNSFEGITAQLHAIVPVPEPAAISQLVGAVLCGMLLTSPRRYWPFADWKRS